MTQSTAVRAGVTCRASGVPCARIQGSHFGHRIFERQLALVSQFQDCQRREALGHRRDAEGGVVRNLVAGACGSRTPVDGHVRLRPPSDVARARVAVARSAYLRRQRRRVRASHRTAATASTTSSRGNRPPLRAFRRVTYSFHLKAAMRCELTIGAIKEAHAAPPAPLARSSVMTDR